MVYGSVLRIALTGCARAVPCHGIGSRDPAFECVVLIMTANCEWHLQAGQERFRSMVRIYYRGAAAAILCCDLAESSSFDELPKVCSTLSSSDLQLNDPVMLSIWFLQRWRNLLLLLTVLEWLLHVTTSFCAKLN